MESLEKKTSTVSHSNVRSALKNGLFIVGNFFGNKRGTPTTQAEELKKMLVRRGAKVYVASQYLGRLPRLLDTLWSLWKYRPYYQVVNIQFYGGLALILEDAASWLAKRLGKQIIFTLHGGAIPDKVKKYPNWYKRVWKRGAVITCPSPYLIDRLTRQGFDLNFQLLENSIPLEEYHFHPKTTFGPNLLWMRSFHPIYNPEMAIEVMQLLLKQYPSATLYMAGSDLGYFEGIKAKVTQLGLQRHILFPGYLRIEDKNRLAEQCDIYICTNRIDNTPVSLIEMMAMGLPVVTTNTGGIPYMLEHEQDALLVHSEDAQGMSNAIIHLIQNPALGQKLVANGRRLLNRYAEATVADKWIDLLIRLEE